MSSSARSAKQLLIDWANEQDGWVRAVATEVLSTRRELAPALIQSAKDLYLAEKQLTPGELPEVPAIANGSDEETTGEALRLVSLRDCRGVNALADGQEIMFNPKMTVLFGENAVGKTGYVRVLKRLAAVRSVEPIIPDIHRASVVGGPEAAIRYALGDSEQEILWHDETGVAPFTRLTIFDSPAVALHLEDNVTYVYTPADLALFKYVHQGIEEVRALLEGEASSRQPRQNPFLTAFTRGSALYPKIEGLSASTDIRELEDLAAITDEDRATLEALKVSVEALTSASSEGRTEMLRARVAVLRNLVTICEAVGQFQASAFSEAVAAASTAREQQERAAADVFGGGQLPEQLRPAWQAFIQAGERYLQVSDQASYPNTRDLCIYCRQELDDAASTLLVAYREFARGTHAAAVEDATARVGVLEAPVMSNAVTSAITGLQTMLPSIQEGEQPPEWATDGVHVVDGIEKIRQAVAQRAGAETGETAGRAIALLPLIRAGLAETELTLGALEGDVQERTRTLADERARVAQLEARITLARLLPEIQTYVEGAAWADRLRTLLGRFQGLLRSLTETSKVASETALNRDFERVFYEECAALRAPNVTLDFPGRRGQAARHKSVTPDHSLREILSEGEQKVVAIADFLAEASLRVGSAPIIFDDPVTSLDYRRLHEMVRRIASLSDAHQVVVFTHNIWFASELLAEFETRPSDCDYYQVVEHDGAKGYVTRAIHPRLDTPAKIKGRINKAIQDAAAAPDDQQEKLVEGAYNDIRAWCEVTVEKDVLQSVTQRHRPNVAMQNLDRIRVDRLGATISVIFSVWEKACRYIPGHSQPLETLAVRPTVEELRQDWEQLQGAMKAYLAD